MPLVETDRVNEETRLDMRIRFNAAKLLQSDINAWMTCEFGPCRKHKACIGGPRGTCTRTGGWPACTQEGKARMAETTYKWRRTKTYDTETPTERSLRRLEDDMRSFDLMLKAQGV